MKQWIVVFGLAALSLGIYVLVEVSSAEPRAPSQARPAHATPPAVVPLATRRPDPPGLAAALDGKPAGPAEPKPSEERALPAAPLSGDEMRDRVAASFEADSPVASSQDRAPELARRIRAMIAPGSSVRSLECRSSLCRLETMHASLDDFRGFMQHAFHAPDAGTRVSNGPVLAALLAPPVAGQPVIAVAYLGREGSVPSGMPAGPASGL